MAVNKETEAAWARGRCIEQDQNGQVGRKVIELEHVRGCSETPRNRINRRGTLFPRYYIIRR